ncbi:UNVERIFIED_CONTAM: hypothetical protein Slati_0096300 [Sesamum latifolium]|uniref:Uncharacterized protein n=1 Tax=Sesamum latifolium TaxID=2727402 RepID=A0AAW2Y8J4_9LAMI
MSVAVYFTKLKKLWDELVSLDPKPSCSCGASKKISEKTASNQLIQFLMGLSDAYDHVRSQVVLMDPLPTVGKAYSMFLRLKKQREVYSGISEEGLMAAQFGEVARQIPTKDLSRCVDSMTRNNSIVKCKKSGHSREYCFELTGFPYWYRDLMEQRRRNGRALNARAMNVQLEDRESSIQGASGIETQSKLFELVRTEVMRALQTPDINIHRSNFAEYEDFASTALTLAKNKLLCIDSWIIDSGASTHMCVNAIAFNRLVPLRNKAFIKLLDGTIQKKCVVQDLQTKEVVAVGR